MQRELVWCVKPQSEEAKASLSSPGGSLNKQMTIFAFISTELTNFSSLKTHIHT